MNNSKSYNDLKHLEEIVVIDLQGIKYNVIVDKVNQLCRTIQKIYGKNKDKYLYMPLKERLDLGTLILERT
jgi:hypothetical protein